MVTFHVYVQKGNGSVAGDEPKPPEDNNRLKVGDPRSLMQTAHADTF